jgi:Arc/MetJ family transcription regulator
LLKPHLGLRQRVHPWMCILWCMRTNIEIDDRVLHEAQKLIGARTKREAVDVALRELVARHRRIGVLDLRGRVRWEGNLDESRRGRS